MIVYDIVHIVSPAAASLTSYTPGRWWQESHDSKDTAESLAETYNRCRGLDCHCYAVEEHDEESDGRAPVLADLLRGARD